MIKDKVDQSISRNCGRYGTVEDFLNSDKEEYLNALKSFVNDDLALEVGEEQIISWQDCYDFLEEKFKDLIEIDHNYNKLYIAFEYTLPMEGGRRADVLLFARDRVIVLEFKRKANYSYDDIEQAIGYQRDLINYHRQTNKQDLEVIAYLVLTKALKNYSSQNGVEILNKDNFTEKLSALSLASTNKELLVRWLNSNYEPLASIVDATLNLFKKGKLPEIKNIEEGEIKDTVDYLKEIIHYNEIKQKEKNLVFVTGVPGSGKTLVALKVLYDYNSYKFKKDKRPLSAIYLSGNGPLISVLQSILSDEVDQLGKTAKSYIRSVHSYKREHMNNSKPSIENVVLFDEAQRAWDKDKMNSSDSEAQFLLKNGHKIYRTQGSATIVCFMGEGQAIHTGEEEGIKLWQDALEDRWINGWNIYCPPKYEKFFKQGDSIKTDKRLNLDYSIRSNFIDTSSWIEALLNSEFASAKKHLERMYSKGFILRITRNFKKAKDFIKRKEAESKGISYGLVVSSKAKDWDIKDYINDGRYFGSYIKNEEVGEWFKGDNKKLEKGASEFACQGLELDYPIVCFGGDYYYNGEKWEIEEDVRRYNSAKYKDFDRIIENIYRVLLSRARQGMILYIPKLDRLDKTYKVLVESGIQRLDKGLR